jgi:uncharacterized protein (TIGR03435 family)
MKAVPAGNDRHSPIQGYTDNVTGDRVPINYLCFWLGQVLEDDHRPVVDETGLMGTYSFKLKFRMELEPSVDAADAGESDDLPTVFQALRDQLGLELTPERRPVTKLVIDHIEKPTEN